MGNYPFTTLTPSLGVVQAGWGEPFVVADIPGLIEGAHKGAGLGIQFLRHIERTRILLHLIDASEIDPDHPLSVYETINTELALYNETLAKKPQIVVLNKLDIPGASERAEMFRAAAKGMQVMSVSAATRDGIEALISQLIQLLDNHS